MLSHRRAGFGFALLLGMASLVLITSVRAGVNDAAKAAFQAGNFDQCITILAGELRKKPDHQDNIRLLEQAIPLSFNRHKSTAEEASARFDWDLAVSEYKAIDVMRQTLSEIPPVPKKVEGKKEKELVAFAMEDMSPQRLAAAEKARDMHYKKATDSEAAGQFRQAAVEYRLTRQYDVNFGDAESKYNACREKAMLKIAVMPFEDKTGRSYGALGDMLTQQVISSAMNSQPEFLQFVTRDYLQQILAEQGTSQSGVIDETSAAQLGKLLGVHAFVFGKLLTIIENFPPDIAKADSRQETYQTKNGSYTQSCSWVVHTREGKVKVQGSFQVVEVQSGVIKKSSNIEKEETDRACWITYTGEQDVIPGEVIALQTPGGERNLKSPPEMAQEAINELGTQLAATLVGTF